jgi:NAD-dependent deacetylase
MNPKIIIFTGAGISAESGISTFRDSDGLWENHKIEDVCSEDSWQDNFELVHNFYNDRRTQLNEVEPNRAHKIVAQLSETYGEDCYIITQNVDDLFERAGCKDVIHLHGELSKMNCTSCGKIWHVGYKKFDTSKDCCPNCNSIKGVKPYIVFFGGNAPKYVDLNNAFESLTSKDIVIVIGTMGNVVSIEYLLHGRDCKKILNNLEPSKYIAEEIFDKVYYENATTAIDKIADDIEEFLAK